MATLSPLLPQEGAPLPALPAAGRRLFLTDQRSAPSPPGPHLATGTAQSLQFFFTGLGNKESLNTQWNENGDVKIDIYILN